MPRIRTFKPEAPQHRKVGRLSIWARWLWFVMVTQADDDGRLVAEPGQLRIIAFGYDRQMTDGRMMQLLEEITDSGLIRLYKADGVPYADFPSWRDHQRINRYTKSKLPSYNDSVSTHGGLTEDSLRTHAGTEGNGTEGNGTERKGTAPAALVVSDGFEEFWTAYPKKKAKDAARRAWRTLTPDPGLRRVILASIEAHKGSVDWTRDNGQYIPHPATWLNGKRWTDEVMAVQRPLMNPNNEAVLKDFLKRRGQ